MHRELSIKEKINLCRQQISLAQGEIVQYQEQCNHPDKKKGYSSWRPGVMDPVMLCTECDKILENLEPEPLQELQVVQLGIDWGEENARSVGQEYTFTKSSD